MEIFKFIKRLHDDCIRLSVFIVFDKKYPRHRYIVGLYGSLIELTGSLIILVEKKHSTGVPSILRSFLEAYVAFVNLYADENYVKYMYASFHKQWLKVLREAKYNPNPFLKSISEFENIDAKINEHEKELDNLESKKFRPLNVFECFEKAGMVNEYRSLYNFLSNDSHSNIRSLENRHLEIYENDFKLVYYKDNQLVDFLPTLDSTAGLLVDATLKIHQYFKTKSKSEIEKWYLELTEICNRYLDYY